jgi:hypothetical protein
MKTLLLFLALTGLAFAGPPKKKAIHDNVYVAVGNEIYKTAYPSGTWYTFTCKNAEGDVIYVGISEADIKSIELQETKESVSYK